MKLGLYNVAHPSEAIFEKFISVSSVLFGRKLSLYWLLVAAFMDLYQLIKHQMRIKKTCGVNKFRDEIIQMATEI